jgi:Rod binding domain-containing protein
MDKGAVRPAAMARSLRAGNSRSPGGRSLEEVSRRFAAVFYRLTLKSMMDTIPGRDGTSAVGGAGWQFMGRHLPRQLAGDGQGGLVHYIEDSLETRTGERVNERM